MLHPKLLILSKTWQLLNSVLYIKLFERFLKEVFAWIRNKINCQPNKKAASLGNEKSGNQKAEIKTNLHLHFSRWMESMQAKIEYFRMWQILGTRRAKNVLMFTYEKISRCNMHLICYFLVVWRFYYAKRQTLINHPVRNDCFVLWAYHDNGCGS